MNETLRERLLAVTARVLAEDGKAGPDFEFYLENPREKAFGDWSLNVAMKLARNYGRPPQEIARHLVSRIETELEREGLAGKFDKIEVRLPGFINFFLSHEALTDVVRTVLDQKNDYGRGRQRSGKTLVEYVSANPTGPLSIAHARQAAVGDSLIRILNFAGFPAQAEYYINDEGNQISLLGESLRCRYRERLGLAAELPENGYRGDYLALMAEELVREHGDSLVEADISWFAEKAATDILSVIRSELADFEVRFDSWFSQKELSVSGDIQTVLEYLKKNKFAYEQDGALWFRSTDHGDDKDRVLIKSNGQLTYLTPDIAYHRRKYEQGFTRMINIWGPDHHGYINRLKAAVAALGHDPQTLRIVIIQLASLFRGGKPVMMSTRAGEYVTLRELMDEVGRDAARFFFLMRRCDTQLEFDLELAKKKTPENPVYYVQYAHARIAGILAVKESRGVEAVSGNPRLELLQEDETFDLIRALNRFPDVIEACAHELDPLAMTVYLRELSRIFHVFYGKHRVVSEDSQLTAARLSLVECVRQVLFTGLDLIGVSSPERM